jgi:hypothetical protein
MAYNFGEDEKLPPLLTKQDLAVASYALAEVFNSYLELYEAEDFSEMSKENMESSMNRLRQVYNKLDMIVQSTEGANNDSEV